MTWGEIDEAVQREALVDDDSVTDADRLRFANEACRSFARRLQPSWLGKAGTISISDGADSGPLPSDFCMPLHFYLVEGGDVKPLRPLELVGMRDTYPPGTTPGEPMHFCLFGGEVLVGPPTSGARTVYADYIAYPETLAGTSATNVVTTKAPELVIARVVEMCLRYQREYEEAELYRARADAMERALEVEDRRAQAQAMRTGGGVVAPGASRSSVLPSRYR